MLLRELIREAAYDSMVDAMQRRYPDQTDYIQSQLQWARQNLKKADRVTWFLRILDSSIANGGKVDAKLLGDYNFSSLEQMQTDIAHYFGYNYAPIDNYQFGRQSVADVINGLTKLENAWKKTQEKHPAVTPQQGDYPLLEFAGGYRWWWVDRAYCDQEGRSGGHCGNVTGRHKTDQKILSFRTPQNQVLLTFILEPNGYLGEMKARNNQKPQDKYHPYIVKLLDLDIVQGISSGGYAPHMNFSMFDLNEEQLKYFLQNKPQLLETQLEFTPIEIMRAPESIQADPRLQEVAIQSRPGLQGLLGKKNTTEDWTQAVEYDPDLVVYAPHDIPNFEKRLLDYFYYKTGQRLISAPTSITRNPELMAKIIEDGDHTGIGGVSPNLKFYEKLAIISLERFGQDSWKFVPEDKRTPEVCEAAARGGVELYDIPQELRTYQVCLLAVNENGNNLGAVPDDLRDRKMYEAAMANGNWQGRNSKEFENAPEDIKLELIKRDYTSINGFSKTTESMRIVAYQEEPSVMADELLKGHYPTAEEQRAAYKGGWSDTEIENQINWTKNKIEKHIISINDSINRLDKKNKELTSNLNDRINALEKAIKLRPSESDFLNRMIDQEKEAASIEIGITQNDLKHAEKNLKGWTQYLKNLNQGHEKIGVVDMYTGEEKDAIAWFMKNFSPGDLVRASNPRARPRYTINTMNKRFVGIEKSDGSVMRMPTSRIALTNYRAVQGQ